MVKNILVGFLLELQDPKPTPVELVELNLRIEKTSDDEGYFLFERISPGGTVAILGTKLWMMLSRVQNSIFRLARRSGRSL